MTLSRFKLLAFFGLGFCPLALTATDTEAAAKGPVKVVILAGQSNMEGKAMGNAMLVLLPQ